MTPERAARGAVGAVFFINGFTFGSLVARMPAVRDHAGLTNGELGLALACVATGAIVALPVAGVLAARHGSRPVTRGAIALACAAVLLPALATSLATLAPAFLLMGITIGALDVTMNAHGVAVERRYGRPILSGFHALFSFGGLAGAGSAALAAAVALDLRVHLLAVALLSLAVGLLWSRRFLPAAEDANGRGDPIVVRPPRRLWALGALAFACLLAEGAAADWSAVYVRDDLGAAAAVAALAYTAFSLTMAVGRLAGDGLAARLGAEGVVRAGGLLAAGGFGLALLADATPAAFVGFACLGAGLAGIVPVVFRAASTMPGIAAGYGLAAVSSMGYLGFVAGPPLIGALAELFDLPVALGLLVVLGAVIAVLARATRERGRTVVLADLDGVLVDSHASIERAWRWWAERRGVDHDAIARLQAGRPSAEVVAELAPHLDAAAEAAAIDERQALDSTDVVALPGARELFERFGDGRLAVVTSCTVPLATARITSAGLPLPDILVTPERLTRGKPDPQGYRLAARELGAHPRDCVVLEDAPAGVAAGRAAGALVVGIGGAALPEAHEHAATIAEWLLNRGSSPAPPTSAGTGARAPRRSPARDPEARRAARARTARGR